MYYFPATRSIINCIRFYPKKYNPTRKFMMISVFIWPYILLSPPTVKVRSNWLLLLFNYVYPVWQNVFLLCGKTTLSPPHVLTLPLIIEAPLVAARDNILWHAREAGSPLKAAARAPIRDTPCPGPLRNMPHDQINSLVQAALCSTLEAFWLTLMQFELHCWFNFKVFNNLDNIDI